MRNWKCAAALAALAGAASVHGQVVINEVYANPPGSGFIDDQLEYVELYGAPGLSLTGYALACVFGGADQNQNEIPGPLPSGWDNGDEVPEIDEAWSLDGLTIGPSGFLVLINNNANSSAYIQQGVTPPVFPIPSGTTIATFAASHIPTVDAAGRIKNDGSQSYVLVRRRPFHTVNGSGISVYDGVAGNTIVNGPLTYPAGIRYAWRKDVNPDVNFNGRIDFNGVGTLVQGGAPNPPETPVNSERPGAPATPAPRTMEPYQMVDDLACSNGGGKEYVRSSEQEISSTPGFNPDAFSRVAYYLNNPNLGDRVNSQSQVVPTRMADEEFIYGELPIASSLEYSSTLSGGPTQPGQTPGSRFNDISRVGFRLTPGGFNDGGVANVVQFRFVPGDLNFSGVVDCDDVTLAESLLGATLDDQQTFIDDNNTQTAADDFSYTGWKWQGRGFQTLLILIRMNPGDGDAVTQADVDAVEALVSGGCTPCPLDLSGNGFVDADDIFAFLNIWFAGPPGGTCTGCAADWNDDGNITADDIFAFLNEWFAFGPGQPCP